MAFVKNVSILLLLLLIYIFFCILTAFETKLSIKRSSGMKSHSLSFRFMKFTY